VAIKKEGDRNKPAQTSAKTQKSPETKRVRKAVSSSRKGKNNFANGDATRQEQYSVEITKGETAQEFAESIIDTVREPLIALDQDLRVVTASRSFYEFFKVKPEETVGQLIYELGNKQWNIPKLRELLETILPQKAAFDNYEVEHDFATIGRRIMLLNAWQIQRVLGKERIILLAIEDITERKKTEEIIQASLKEKETLLKEVHHRVKTNMQVICSLLNLQSSNVRDKDALAMLKDSQSRIQSMALVHNKLYQSQNLASINMSDYIKELTGDLIKSYTTSHDRVTVNIDPSDVFLGIDMAIPCGLVINELVTNSLKYAFPKNRTGQIAISLKEGGNQELELVVSDNDVGIPEGINTANTNTFGLKLVTNLAQDQLDGKIELDRSRRTTFKITFPQAKEEQ
jgi:PAS domain S-box-containing protein